MKRTTARFIRFLPHRNRILKHPPYQNTLNYTDITQLCQVWDQKSCRVEDRGEEDGRDSFIVSISTDVETGRRTEGQSPSIGPLILS